MPIKIDREVEISLDKIIKDWDVRLHAGSADEGRVDLLAGLYEDGKKVDLIEVAPPNSEGFYRLIEGRTRHAALLKNRTKKTRVSVLTPATDEEYIAYAYNCNCSGPKPPDFDDLKVTVELLMLRKMTKKEIMKLFPHESETRLGKACDQVRSNTAKNGVAKAKTMLMRGDSPELRGIADGEERIRIAAKVHGVTVKAVKKSINGTPGIKKNSFLNEVKKDLGGMHNRRSMWVKDWIKRIDVRYTDFNYPTEQIFAVFDHIIKQLQSETDTMKEARGRFEIRINGGKASAKTAGA